MTQSGLRVGDKARVKSTGSTGEVVEIAGTTVMLRFGVDGIFSNYCGYMPCEVEPADTVKQDSVDSPAHYKLGGIEVIDAIEAWDLNFRLANVVKYVARAGKKTEDGKDPAAKRLEDLKKARWYLDREIEKSSGK